MNETIPVKDKLIQDFKSMLTDFEGVVRDGASHLGEKASVMREQIDQNLRRIRGRLEDVESQMLERGKVVAKVTDDYVHDHPWESAGAAFGVGLLVGILINRR